jgi:uncharacterized DUF497 family protein
VRITGVVWLRSVIEKLADKHQVSQQEVEGALRNRPRIRRIALGDVAGEDLYAALSQTDDGRYLIVFFIHKPNGEALIISARDMSPKERKSYGKK